MRTVLGIVYIVFGLALLGLAVAIVFALGPDIGAVLFLLFIAWPLIAAIGGAGLWLIGIGLASLASTKIWP